MRIKETKSRDDEEKENVRQDTAEGEAEGHEMRKAKDLHQEVLLPLHGRDGGDNQGRETVSRQRGCCRRP